MKIIHTFLLALLLCTTAHAREWRSADGSTIEAEFVRERLSIVYLRKADESTARIRLEQLSQADQEYLLEQGLLSPATALRLREGEGGGVGGQAVSAKLLELLGNDLIDSQGNPVNTAQVMRGKKLVAIYFSASWCPPCRAFSPVLKRAYQAYNGEHGDLEIILVGSDRTNAKHLEYASSMPWLTAKLNSGAAQRLRNKLGERGIPQLAVLNAEGEEVERNARTRVQRDGAAGFEHFRE